MTGPICLFLTECGIHSIFFIAKGNTDLLWDIQKGDKYNGVNVILGDQAYSFGDPTLRYQ